MHLVEEEDRALAPLAEAVPGPLEHVAHVLHAGADRAELLEGLAGVGGDGLGERGLAGARRPPEDHRREPVAPRPACAAAGPAPSSCSCPTMSSSVRGRRRAASGALAASASSAAEENRSSAIVPTVPHAPLPSAPTSLYSAFQPFPRPTTTTFCGRSRPPCDVEASTDPVIPRGIRMAVEHVRRARRAGAATARARHHRPGGRAPRARAARRAGSPSAGSSRSSRRVFRLAGAPETWHQAVHGGAARRPTAIVSHRSAAELWGLIQPAATSTSPSARTTSRGSGRPRSPTGSTTSSPELAVERRACRSPTRSARSSTSASSSPSGRWATRSSRGHLAPGSSRSPRSSGSAMRSAARAATAPGSFGELLEERPAHGRAEESELEKRLADLARRHDLPAYDLQHEVWHAGRFIARVDAAYPERSSWRSRSTATSTTPPRRPSSATARRQNRLVALGWTVLRFTWDDVVKRPGDGRQRRSARPIAPPRPAA